jgi:hypothetical protein
LTNSASESTEALRRQVREQRLRVEVERRAYDGSCRE